MQGDHSHLGKTINYAVQTALKLGNNCKHACQNSIRRLIFVLNGKSITPKIVIFRCNKLKAT